jgi:hypothetical protein
LYSSAPSCGRALGHDVRQTFGSRPCATPRFSASAVPAINMPSSMLLQIFATCPAPAAGVEDVLAHAQHGRARSAPPHPRRR